MALAIFDTFMIQKIKNSNSFQKTDSQALEKIKSWKENNLHK